MEELRPYEALSFCISERHAAEESWRVSILYSRNAVGEPVGPYVLQVGEHV